MRRTIATDLPHHTLAGAAGLTLLILLAGSLSADTLTLTDGTVYEGRIVERNNDYVLMEVNSGGISSASLKFEASKVQSWTISPPESTQVMDAFRRKWSAAEEARTAVAFVEAGRWAQENKLHDKAIEAFEQARALDPEQGAGYGLLIAQNLALGNNLRAARTMLKNLATTFPDYGPIAGELARMDQQVGKRVEGMIRLAVDGYKKGDMRACILLAERVQRLDVDDALMLAEAATRQQAGLSFARLLADARLHQPCANCSGDMQSGLVACPTCRGTGKVTKTRLETLTDKDPKTGAERRRSYQVEYQAVCPTCKGFASTLCPACGGAGVDLGKVGPVEKALVVEGLRKRIEFLTGKLADVAAEPSSLQPVNLEVVHLHVLRARYYLQQYPVLCPDLAGDALATFVDRRTALDNLCRQSSTLYRNRELDDYREAIKAQLAKLVRTDGILNPEDLDFRDPPEASSSTNRPGPKP